MNIIEQKTVGSNFAIKSEISNIRGLFKQPINKVFKPLRSSQTDDVFRKSSSLDDLSTKFTGQATNNSAKDSKQKTFLVASSNSSSQSIEENPLYRDSKPTSLAVNKGLKDNQCELFLEVMKESKIESLLDCIVSQIN